MGITSAVVKIDLNPLRAVKPKPETRNPKLFSIPNSCASSNGLHLVAKRLSWAGAKGEHAASRKGFSLEFSDYRRYQPATICVTSIGISTGASSGCC